MKAFVIVALTAFSFLACGEQGQQASEEANRDTMPVIETNPADNTSASPAGVADSATADSAVSR